MAGGGVKGGSSVGETDEWGYKAVQDRYEIHDLHATMLHLLGVEHTKSTFRFSGPRHAPHRRARARYERDTGLSNPDPVDYLTQPCCIS